MIDPKRGKNSPQAKYSRYIIPLSPVVLSHTHHLKSREWDERKADIVALEIDLNRQHSDRDLIDGEIAIEIDFYFNHDNGSRRRKDEATLVRYVEYFIRVARNIVIDPNCMIISIVASKRYEDKARIEAMIIENI